MLCSRLFKQPINHSINHSLCVRSLHATVQSSNRSVDDGIKKSLEHRNKRQKINEAVKNRGMTRFIAMLDESLARSMARSKLSDAERAALPAEILINASQLLNPAHGWSKFAAKLEMILEAGKKKNLKRKEAGKDGPGESLIPRDGRK